MDSNTQYIKVMDPIIKKCLLMGSIIRNCPRPAIALGREGRAVGPRFGGRRKRKRKQMISSKTILVQFEEKDEKDEASWSMKHSLLIVFLSCWVFSTWNKGRSILLRTLLFIQLQSSDLWSLLSGYMPSYMATVNAFFSSHCFNHYVLLYHSSWVPISRREEGDPCRAQWHARTKTISKRLISYFPLAHTHTLDLWHVEQVFT